MDNLVRIEIQIDDRYADRVSSQTLRTVAETAIRRELISGPDYMSVTITCDDRVRLLNLEFRGLDEPTDVLAFGMPDADKGSIPINDDTFVLPPDQEPSLGELVIAFEQASKQAAWAGRTVEQEIMILTAHGTLHLLGFDHDGPLEQSEMFMKTDAILNEILGSEAESVMSNTYHDAIPDLEKD